MPYVYCTKTGKLNSVIFNLPPMDTFFRQLTPIPFFQAYFPGAPFLCYSPTFCWDTRLEVSRTFSLQKFCMHLCLRAHVIAVSCIPLGKQRYTALAHYETLRVTAQVSHCNKTVPRHFHLIHIFNQFKPSSK